METFYLNSYTESVRDFENSFRYILPGSTVEAKTRASGFSSDGYGLLSEGYYLGQNITKNLIELKINKPNGIVFQIPLKGYYTTRVSNKSIKCTPERGCLILPTKSFEYTSDLEIINDMFIVVDYMEIKQILDARYEPFENDKYFFPIEKKGHKTEVIYNLLIHNLKAIKTYPHLENSIHFISSIKETSKLFLVELLADLLDLKPLKPSTSDAILLDKVERMIISRPETFFNIYQIAKMCNTTPRKLQILFKKHRNCSPMQFLKKRKLIKARGIITKTNGNYLIKQVAIDSGFSNLSTFSRDYKKQFGELPSTTLKQFA